VKDEENISAEPPSSEKDPWFPPEDEDSRRAKGPEATSSERPEAADGLMGEGLKPRERIKKKKDFLFLYRKGTRIKVKHFNVIYHENSVGFSRLGVVVSKKIGKAVVRNKIKRWVRELFRRNKNLLSFPVDMLVVATRRLEATTWVEFREEYFQAIQRINRGEKSP